MIELSIQMLRRLAKQGENTVQVVQRLMEIFSHNLVAFQKFLGLDKLYLEKEEKGLLDSIEDHYTTYLQNTYRFAVKVSILAKMVSEANRECLRDSATTPEDIRDCLAQFKSILESRLIPDCIKEGVTLQKEIKSLVDILHGPKYSQKIRDSRLRGGITIGAAALALIGFGVLTFLSFGTAAPITVPLEVAIAGAAVAVAGVGAGIMVEVRATELEKELAVISGHIEALGKNIGRVKSSLIHLEEMMETVVRSLSCNASDSSITLRGIAKIGQHLQRACGNRLLIKLFFRLRCGSKKERRQAVWLWLLEKLVMSNQIDQYSYSS